MYSDVIFHPKTFITSLNYRDQITPLIIPLSNYLSTNYPISAQKKSVRSDRTNFSRRKFRKHLKKARWFLRFIQWTNASRGIERGSGGMNFSGGVEGAIIKAGVADTAWGEKREEKKKKQQASARMRKLRKHPAERKEIHPRSRKIRSTRTGVPQRGIRRGASHVAPLWYVARGLRKRKRFVVEAEPCFPEKKNDGRWSRGES